MSTTMGLLEDAFVYGRGYEELVRGIVPAAGSSFTLAIPGETETRAVSIVATLTTGAAVANRYLTCQYLNNNGEVYSVNGAAVVVTANTTQRFVWQLGRGAAEWASGTDVFCPLQDIFLEPGHQLQLNVANIQAADTLTGIQLVLQRFPTGSRGYEEGARPRHAAHRRR